ncbi:hypothetical protein BCR37DRAFT_376507 [Protomyces lactucae-debilis]|uniref:Amino acid/polyamine transporter I n=1 Tax=Protomyces lactucae-debilis TaxID=2754530 RepID=A0A1Y2FWR2_PROLT|nr:uncharacterized protein BCR37DRAFT_376507 [Protomyces lactucae-debilis]ORY87115.1 hypothetical protein BCR37DRAFT_376507 [Protomyces lactucae-debilis]
MSEENRKLAALGYKPVFKREFSALSTFSFAFSISGLFATITTTYSYGLYAGGAPSAVWCWLVAGAGCMCIALSVAELVSAYPTSGGLYFTMKYLVPKNQVPIASWMCGWLNLLGQVAGVASTDYGCAQLLLAAVSMGSDFSYTPTPDHTVAVMVGIVAFHGAVNTLSTRWLDRITKFYAIFHLAVLFSCSVALLVLQKNKTSARAVFVDIVPASGWNNKGWSFLFGFLSVAWCMTDYDATAHIAEEIENAAIRAPQAIASALGLTYGLGFLFNIVLAFTMGDVTEILASPIAQPVAQIFYNVMGKSGGITFTVFAFIILNFTGITALQANARTIWALSRDEMLPGSRFWYKISSVTGTPIIAVWLNVAFCCCINLIGLGSYTAIAAIFNVTAIALDMSYCIPIVSKLLYTKKLNAQGQGYRPGPWNLGKWSPYVNAYGVAWVFGVTTIFLFPVSMPVTPENMNYAVVLLVGIALFAAIYWLLGAKNYYTGPRTSEESDMHAYAAQIEAEESTKKP